MTDPDHRKFRLIENLEAMACRNSAERVVKAVSRGDLSEAKKLARMHELAWDLADRDFKTLNPPHTTNDFCDDE